MISLTRCMTLHNQTNLDEMVHTRLPFVGQGLALYFQERNSDLVDLWKTFVPTRLKDQSFGQLINKLKVKGTGKFKRDRQIMLDNDVGFWY